LSHKTFPKWWPSTPGSFRQHGWTAPVHMAHQLKVKTPPAANTNIDCGIFHCRTIVASAPLVPRGLSKKTRPCQYVPFLNSNCAFGTVHLWIDFIF
jgi:hypothetical protein